MPQGQSHLLRRPYIIELITLAAYAFSGTS